VRTRRRVARARAIAALVALAVSAAPAFAQPPLAAPNGGETPAVPATPAPAPTPAPPPAPVGPVAIPTAEIAANIDAAYKRVAEIQATAEPEPIILEIEKEAFGKEQLFHQRVLEAAQKVEGEVSLDELEEIEARASSADKQLSVWQKALSARSQQLEASRVALKELRETWSLTLDQARKDGAPNELIENVKGVRAEMRSVDKLLADRFDAILKLQGRVGEESLAVSVLSQDVRRARYEVRGRLFERDRLPLHAAILAVGTVEPVRDRVKDGLERDARSIRTFASLEGGQRIIVHVLVFFAFLLLAVRMKVWSVARRRAGKTLGPSEEVLDHPLSTSLLFAVLLTPWIHPFLPRSYLNLLGLLTVIPILVLLPDVLAPQFRRVWYLLAGIFLLDRVRGVFQPVELIERTIFLVETLGGAGLALHMLRGERFAPLVAARWTGLLRSGLRIAGVALVTSSLANLAGFVSLSRLIGQGILRSALSAVVLYAAVSVTRPLLAGLLRTTPARAMHVLHGRRDAIERIGGRAIGALATLWWLARTLEGFTVADRARYVLDRFFTAPIPLGAVAFSLGDVLLFLATAAGGILAARLVRVLLEEDVFPRTHLTRGVPHAISATVRYAILVGAFLLAAAAAGFDWSRITLLAGAFGVGIGFGLQNIVNNFISGLILLYERPIQVGDTVEVGSLVGEVKRIGIRSSSVRTWQGAEVIVPNGNLISEQVVNWTLSDRTRRIEVPVGVSYDADPELVQSLLEQVGATHPDVMSEPPPMALFLGFGDSALNFELRIWTSNFDRAARVRSELTTAVHRALKQAGIAIPFPQRDVRVVLSDTRARD